MKYLDQVSVLKEIFRKILTSGGVDGSKVVVEVCDVDPDRQLAAQDSGSDVTSRRPVSAVMPVSSLTSAVVFAQRFLEWCASNNIHGPIELPRIYVLSLEFAEYKNLRPATKMALSKSLSGLGIPKSMRQIADHERGLVSKKRSEAVRSRITVYTLPAVDVRARVDYNDQQDLFD